MTSNDSSDKIDFSQSRPQTRDRPAKWVNPCRINSAVPVPNTPEFQIQQQSDADIFQNIITQVSKAENQAKKFIREFYKECFGGSVDDDSYRDIHYDWLENTATAIGKILGEEIDSSKFEAMNVEDTLRTMYEGLQKFAVGLEQVVLDQSVYGGSFHQQFHEAEYQLKYVLCELQIAMMEKNVSQEDVQRHVMSEEYRDLDETTKRNVRDWLIFRDYVNTLEYIRQVFTLFLRRVEAQA